MFIRILPAFLLIFSVCFSPSALFAQKGKGKPIGIEYKPELFNTDVSAHEAVLREACLGPEDYNHKQPLARIGILIAEAPSSCNISRSNKIIPNPKKNWVPKGESALIDDEGNIQLSPQQKAVAAKTEIASTSRSIRPIGGGSGFGSTSGGSGLQQLPNSYGGNSSAKPPTVAEPVADSAGAIIQAIKDWAYLALGLDKINGVTGRGVKIAVIDTGVDAGHSDLAGKIEECIDVKKGNAKCSNLKNPHGTQVAGILVAKLTKDRVYSVAPDARIIAIKATDDNGEAQFSDIAEAILLAVDKKAKIINMSLATNSPNEILRRAIEYATANGVLVVAAVGNNNGAKVGYPAAYNNVIGVAAVENAASGLQLASFSNKGPEVNFIAPGVGIISTDLNNRYSINKGTSLAAPYVTGMAALIWGKQPSLSASAVLAELTKISDIKASVNVGGSGNKLPNATKIK